jgi:hypothetical protein
LSVIYIFVRLVFCSDVGVLLDGVAAIFSVRMISSEKRLSYRLSRIPFGVLEDGGVVFLNSIFNHIPDNKISQIQINKFGEATGLQVKQDTFWRP